MAYLNPIPTLDDYVENDQSENKPDYKPMKEVYFAFIDVLGFKKTFDDIKISKESDIANKYRDVFNYFFTLMNSAKFMEAGEKTGCYAGQTSDSLYFYTDRTDYLMQFIKIFSHFSLYAMSKDVFFRGGIAKGTLYKKEKYQFYGDCVIGAYLLESKISKYPVIVIDEKTHNDMSKVNGYSDFVNKMQERNYIKPFYTLNRKIILDINDDSILNEIDSEKIKNNIHENKNAFEYDANNYAKYVFLLKELEEANNASENII